jgi:hypothetical protein
MEAIQQHPYAAALLLGLLLASADQAAIQIRKRFNPRVGLVCWLVGALLPLIGAVLRAPMVAAAAAAFATLLSGIAYYFDKNRSLQ